MRVATYLRLSRYQADTTSPDRQREACESRARELYPDAEVDQYSDLDISGYQDVERPGLSDLLDNLPQYEALVVYRIDRLTRRGARHLLELVEDYLEPNDVRLVSVQEPVDTSGPYGELFLVLLSTFAKMESQTISERTLDTNQWLRQNGYWVGGHAPWGFRLVEVDGHKRLAIEEDVSWAVERVLEGEALTDVAADTPLTHQGLRSWLTNPAIAGLQHEGGEVVYGEDGEPVMVGEAMIEESTHFRLVELLTSDRSLTVGKYLLTGVLKCAECGYGMNGVMRDWGGQYVCQGEGCPGNVASMRGVESAVEGWVKGELPDMLELGRDQAADSDYEVSSQLNHLSNLTSQLSSLIDDLTINQGRDYDDPQVQVMVERLQNLTAEKSNLQSEQRQRKREPRGDFNVDRWDDLPMPAKRALLGRVCEMFGSIKVKKAASSGGRFDPARVLLPSS